MVMAKQRSLISASWRITGTGNMRYLILLLLLCPMSASAATISFEPQDSSAGTNEPFVIAINLTSEEPVNALEIVLILPPSLTPIDVSDGNSVVPLWLVEPSFDEVTRTLSFSGVIPNGFSGEAARLITLTVIPHTTGTARLSVDASSTIYKGEGIEVPLQSEVLVLPIVEGKHTSIVAPPDDNPPEAFEPTIVVDPLLFEGKNVLVFSTTDKGSGIAGYEVRESWFSWSSTRGWRHAESPYLLRDQSRSSYIFVRALDKKGNVYTVTLEPQQLPLLLPMALIVVVLLVVLYAVYARRHSQV